MADDDQAIVTDSPYTRGLGAYTPPEEVPPPSRGALGYARDTGINILQGALAIPHDIAGATTGVADAAGDQPTRMSARDAQDYMSDLSYRVGKLKTERGQYEAKHPGPGIMGGGSDTVDAIVQTAMGLLPYAPLAVTGPAAPYLGAGIFTAQGYGQTRNAVREQLRFATPEQLAEMPKYKEYRAQGLSHEDAKDRLESDSNTTEAGLIGAGGGALGGGLLAKMIGKTAARDMSEAITARIMEKARNRIAVGAGHGAVSGAALSGGSEWAQQVAMRDAGLGPDVDPMAVGKHATEGALGLGVVGGVLGAFNKPRPPGEYGYATKPGRRPGRPEREMVLDDIGTTERAVLEDQTADDQPHQPGQAPTGPAHMPGGVPQRGPAGPPTDPYGGGPRGPHQPSEPPGGAPWMPGGERMADPARGPHMPGGDPRRAPAGPTDPYAEGAHLPTEAPGGAPHMPGGRLHEEPPPPPPPDFRERFRPEEEPPAPVDPVAERREWAKRQLVMETNPERRAFLRRILGEQDTEAPDFKQRFRDTQGVPEDFLGTEYGPRLEGTEIKGPTGRTQMKAADIYDRNSLENLATVRDRRNELAEQIADRQEKLNAEAEARDQGVHEHIEDAIAEHADLMQEQQRINKLMTEHDRMDREVSEIRKALMAERGAKPFEKAEPKEPKEKVQEAEPESITGDGKKPKVVRETPEEEQFTIDELREAYDEVIERGKATYDEMKAAFDAGDKERGQQLSKELDRLERAEAYLEERIEDHEEAKAQRGKFKVIEGGKAEAKAEPAEDTTPKKMTAKERVQKAADLKKERAAERKARADAITKEFGEPTAPVHGVYQPGRAMVARDIKGAPDKLSLKPGTKIDLQEVADKARETTRGAGAGEVVQPSGRTAEVRVRGWQGKPGEAAEARKAAPTTPASLHAARIKKIDRQIEQAEKNPAYVEAKQRLDAMIERRAKLFSEINDLIEKSRAPGEQPVSDKRVMGARHRARAQELDRIESKKKELAGLRSEIARLERSMRDRKYAETVEKLKAERAIVVGKFKEAKAAEAERRKASEGEAKPRVSEYTQTTLDTVKDIHDEAVATEAQAARDRADLLRNLKGMLNNHTKAVAAAVRNTLEKWQKQADKRRLDSKRRNAATRFIQKHGREQVLKKLITASENSFLRAEFDRMFGEGLGLKTKGWKGATAKGKRLLRQGEDPEALPLHQQALHFIAEMDNLSLENVRALATRLRDHAIDRLAMGEAELKNYQNDLGTKALISMKIDERSGGPTTPWFNRMTDYKTFINKMNRLLEETNPGKTSKPSVGMIDHLRDTLVDHYIEETLLLSGRVHEVDRWRKARLDETRLELSKAAADQSKSKEDRASLKKIERELTKAEEEFNRYAEEHPEEFGEGEELTRAYEQTFEAEREMHAYVPGMSGTELASERAAVKAQGDMGTSLQMRGHNKAKPSRLALAYDLARRTLNDLFPVKRLDQRDRYVTEIRNWIEDQKRAAKINESRGFVDPALLKTQEEMETHLPGAMAARQFEQEMVSKFGKVWNDLTPIERRLAFEYGPTAYVSSKYDTGRRKPSAQMLQADLSGTFEGVPRLPKGRQETLTDEVRDTVQHMTDRADKLHDALFIMRDDIGWVTKAEIADLHRAFRERLGLEPEKDPTSDTLVRDFALVNEELRQIESELREYWEANVPGAGKGEYGFRNLLDPGVDPRDIANRPIGSRVYTVEQFLKRGDRLYGIRPGPDIPSGAIRNHFLDVIDKLTGDVPVIGLTHEQFSLAAVAKDIPQEAPAFYDPVSHRIFTTHEVLSSPRRGEVLGHEVSHPLIEAAIQRFPEIGQRLDEMRIELRDAYRSHDEDLRTRVRNALQGDTHAFKDVYEFIAELVRNPKLATALNEITVDGKTAQGWGTARRTTALAETMAELKRGLNGVLWQSISKKRLLNDATIAAMDLFQRMDRLSSRQRPMVLDDTQARPAQESGRIRDRLNDIKQKLIDRVTQSEYEVNRKYDLPRDVAADAQPVIDAIKSDDRTGMLNAAHVFLNKHGAVEATNDRTGMIAGLNRHMRDMRDAITGTREDTADGTSEVFRDMQEMDKSLPVHERRIVPVADMKTVLDNIAGTSTDLADRKAASLFGPTMDTVKVSVLSTEGWKELKTRLRSPGSGGFYVDDMHHVFIPKSVKPDTMVHEAGHAATSQAIDKYPEFKGTLNDVIDHITSLPEYQKYLGEAKDIEDSFLRRYAFESGENRAHEYVAEFWANRDFRNFLRTLKVPEHIQARAAGAPNLFKATIRLINRFLNRLIGGKPDGPDFAGFTEKMIVDIVDAQRGMIERGEIGFGRGAEVFEAPRRTFGNIGREIWDGVTDRAKDIRYNMEKTGGPVHLLDRLTEFGDLARQTEPEHRGILQKIYHEVGRRFSTQKDIVRQRDAPLLREFSTLLQSHTEAHNDRLFDFIDRERHSGVHADAPLDEFDPADAAKRTGRNRHVGNTLNDRQARIEHKRLQEMWEDLTPQQQAFIPKLKEYYAERYADVRDAELRQIIEVSEMVTADHEGATGALLKFLGGEDLTTAENTLLADHVPGYAGHKDVSARTRLNEEFMDRVRRLRQQPEWRKLQGAYYPSMRRGDFAVYGKHTVDHLAMGGVEINKDEASPTKTWEFETEKGAQDFIDALSKRGDDEPVIKVLNAREVAYEPDAADPGRIMVHPDTGERMRAGGWRLDTEGKPTKEWRQMSLKEAKYPYPDKTPPHLRYQVEINPHQFELHANERKADARLNELTAAGNFEPQFLSERRMTTGMLMNPALVSKAMREMIKSVENSDGYQRLNPAEKEIMRRRWQEAAEAELLSTSGRPRYQSKKYALGADRGMFDDLVQFSHATSHTLAELKHRVPLRRATEEMDRYNKLNEWQKPGIRADVAKYAMRRSQIANEVYKRLAMRRGPETRSVFDKATNVLLKLTYLDRLGSVSFPLVNATEPGMHAMPQLAGVHGYANSAAALRRAYSDLGALREWGGGLVDMMKVLRGGLDGDPQMRDALESFSKKLSDPGEIRMMETLAKHGYLDRDAGFELAYQRSSGNLAMRVLDYADRAVRAANAPVEGVNRGTTALAAYRLHRAAGKSEAEATQFAEHVVHDASGNYAAYNQPAIFSHPVARIPLQFKKYSLRATKNYVRMMAGAFHTLHNTKGRTPDEVLAHKQAAKQLLYQAATMVAVSGALGLPTEPFKLLITATNILGMNPYNTDDVEGIIRKHAAEVLGKDGAMILLRGLPRYLGTGIGERVAHSTLWSYGTAGTKSSDWWSTFGHTVGGASVGSMFDTVQGMQKINNGIGMAAQGAGTAAMQEIMEGTKLVMPVKIAADVTGAVTDELYPRTTKAGQRRGPEGGAGQFVSNVLGIQTGAQLEQREAGNVSRSEIKRYNDEKNRWLTMYVKASNSAEAAGVRDNIFRVFNEKYPEGRITVGELQRAKVRHDKKEAMDPNLLGITLNKRTQQFAPNREVYNY